MANNASTDKWYFTKEQLDQTPSRKNGYDNYKELSYRQQTANFIQDMGQRLKVSQLCINTAIVYMHRFYVFHSFTNFPWHQMAAAALFLAAKVEEQPRKLEYVIRVANMCRNNRDTNIDVNSERYIAQSQDLVFNENVLLQTLGFDVAIDHPHTHVVRCCHLVRASKDLAQSSYFLASNSLHLTTMCLQYKPTVVACFCIHVACKWSSWEIPLSSEKKEWFLYVDPTVTADLLRQLTEEFLTIFEKCPSRLKEKIMAIGDNGMYNTANNIINSPFDTDPKKIVKTETHSHRPHDMKQESENDIHKHRNRPHESSTSNQQQQQQQQREREYREKKEREKLAQQHGMKPLPLSSQTNKQTVSHGHHRQPVDAKLKPPSSRQPSSSSNNNNNNNNSSSSNNNNNNNNSGSAGGGYTGRAEPRDILREAARDSPFGIATKDYNTKETREHNKDAVRDKDVQKRDYLLKPNVSDITNNINNYSGTTRSTDLQKSQIKQQEQQQQQLQQQQVRRHDDKAYNKTENDPKKHFTSNHDKNSTYLSKSSNSTSQKINKSPFTTDNTSKSVPKMNATVTTLQQQQQSGVKQHHHNGSGNSSYLTNLNVKVKDEIKDDVPVLMKMPSLFSPEKSPSPKKHHTRNSPEKQQRHIDSSMHYNTTLIDSMSHQQQQQHHLVSPITTTTTSSRRTRNCSINSEPELRPVMKKIDQVEGFENLMRDSSIGINKLHQIPDIITPIADKEKPDEKLSYSKEMKPPDIIPPLGGSDSSTLLTNQHIIINGIETNPTLISSLLKEAPPIPHLPVVAANTTSDMKLDTHTQVVDTNKEKDKEHHHHKSKKKNKEKHKHKDKDKSKDDKEKKKKHKDKDREKHKHKDRNDEIITEPIKIKIHKDKIQPLSEQGALKIKIPKDIIKTETMGGVGGGGGGGGGGSGGGGNNSSSYMSSSIALTSCLKIKIPKDKINNCNSSSETTTTTTTTVGGGGSSRKRERDKSLSTSDCPPGKIARSSHRDSKQNGRHSYTKVTQMGDGDTSIHRLAESKYINKNSST